MSPSPKAPNIFMHDTLGVVHINVRSNSRRLTARWKGGEVHISVPPGTSSDTLVDFIDQCAKQLLSLKPASLYTVPMQMDFGEFSITIATSKGLRGRIVGDPSAHGLTIRIPLTADPASTNVARAISRTMCSYARHIAPQILIPMARNIAAEIGVAPLGWEISNGHRTLGRCSTRGIIALSYVLVFLPNDLRRFVVCHELAHLSEMNHSARFHAICNTYCHGHEADLIAQMRTFPWPIIK